MHTTDTSEKGLETIIEKHLINHNGFIASYSADYDRDLCINEKLLFEFMAATQPNAHDTIIKRGKDKFLKRLSDQIRQKGIIEILRNGVKDLDLRVQLYFKKPTSLLNDKAQKQYSSNIFSVTRQLYYSLENSNSLDMVLFINGLPLSTFELKNQWTGHVNQISIYSEVNHTSAKGKQRFFRISVCLVLANGVFYILTRPLVL